MHTGSMMYLRILIMLAPLLPVIVSDVEQAVQHFRSDENAVQKAKAAQAALDDVIKLIGQLIDSLGTK